MHSKESALDEKYNSLKTILKGYGKVAVAFSAGVDSTFLLAAAKDALGEDVLAITASIYSSPAREKSQAEEFCAGMGVHHVMLDFNELEIPGFVDNPPDRCYLCKKALFTKILEAAAEQGFPVVAEGSNTDDEGDYRPGMKAIRELEIASPLKEAGLSKADIRALSRKMELPTWDKPSMACLSSRFAYGERITKEKLAMVDRAEEYLADLGLSQVRVRMHGKDVARIEVSPGELGVLVDHRGDVTKELKDIGFRYVTADLAGYRTGSMNEALDK